MKQIIHGGDLYSWRGKHPDVRWLDFSANCNPYGMPDSVKAAYMDALSACEQYPDPLCRELRTAIGGFEQVPPEWIVPGNGASDILYRIAFGLGPKRALLPAPTFAEYALALQAAGCGVSRHLLRRDRGFQLDETILDALPGNDIIFLCNPNNPTGLPIDPALLHRVLDECMVRGITLVVDECFREFLPEPEQHTLKHRLRQSPGLVLVGAFTKYFAIPGLRMGYAITANPATADRLEACGAEWSVSVPAQRCGAAAAGERAFLAETGRKLRLERARLARALTGMGMEVYPSRANYLFFRAGCGDLQERMARQGILIRDCANYPGLEPGYYRIAVRTPEENDRLLAALQTETGGEIG